MDTAKKHAIVVGARSAIGQAITELFSMQKDIESVICFSRGAYPSHLSLVAGKIEWISLSYTESDITTAVESIMDLRGQISRVVICNGILHDESTSPEKRLKDLKSEHFHKVMEANTLVPMLWVNALSSLLRGETPCKVAVFSARVGSIGDNRMGGWYSYRASKSALNMMLKTAAIEYARGVKNVTFVAFHPGTVDTPLSKPFQSAAKIIFTPEFVAEKIKHLLDTIETREPLIYLDWDNKLIAW